MSLLRQGMGLLVRRPVSFLSPQFSTRGLRTIRNQDNAAATHTKTEMLEENKEDPMEVSEFFSKVNQEISCQTDRKRLFAVVHLYGNQHLFSEGDYILLRKYFNIDLGTRIKLEKVMVVGGDNLTLVGRPVLDRDLVHVEATVVEKTMSHTINNSIAVPRRAKYRRWSFNRLPLTILRINQVRICHPINQSPEHIHT